MNMFVWNLLLAISWMVLVGRFTPADLFLGFALSYLVLLGARRTLGPSSYFSKVWQVVTFAVSFVVELILAGLRVAHDVVTPTHHMKPGILAIPLEPMTDAEVALLANLVTLTPGSMSLDVSPDRRCLYVHLMYIDDVEQERAAYRDKLARQTRELLR